MKRPFTQVTRPIPELPALENHPARYAPIPHTEPQSQPDRAVLPLYWWAVELHKQSWGIRGMHFHQPDQQQDSRPRPRPENTLAAKAYAQLTIQRPNYQVVEMIRGTHDQHTDVADLAELVVESMWRLGVAGFADELDQLVKILWVRAILQQPSQIRPTIGTLRGRRPQPDVYVRMAYWWSRALMDKGWVLEGFGEELAGGGFIATLPDWRFSDAPAGSGPVCVYPKTMGPDGTEASALAHLVGELTPKKCRLLAELVEATRDARGQKVIEP